MSHENALAIKRQHGCASADSEASHVIAGMVVAILKVSSAMLQPVLHYELEQVSKIDILRKLKTRFGPKTIRDIRLRVGQ